ncbi:MAG TPA: glutathione S-transferase family protein [Steroidobacteraceae bacterium]|nr:glutathione S-transferase family protein [Steroidobacteraceae bacterium]
MHNHPLLVLGSKNYSSWSLRPWLFLRKLGLEFQELVIHFDEPDYRAQIAALSPSRRVPLLIEAGLAVWDSLAICEYAADRTGRGIPTDRGARAVVRAVAAEMHAGFAALRAECPMNVRARGKRVPQTPQLLADVSRIDALWSDCRTRFGADGPWLFGEFSLADAMFAPVAFRFATYGATLAPASAAYLASVLADPLIEEWRDAAIREGHPLAETDRIGSSSV